MDIRTPDGRPITCWQDWTRPKRDYQWKAGRGAMELARAWFRPGHLEVPQEVAALLCGHPRLQGLVLECGIPEHVTRLPERGEGRNHDLWLLGRTPQEQVTVCVEAKADEPFGDSTVAGYLQKCLQRRARGESTRAPERIASLLRIVDPRWTPQGASPWNELPYQLLTALCGTVLQAQLDQSGVAVLLVHVFETAATTAQKLDANAAAFAQFVNVLMAVPDGQVGPDRLYGPAKVNGVTLFVGKTIGRG